MKRLTSRDPFAIGIAAIAALGLLGGLILLVSTVPFGTRSYSAELSHTAGIRKGESVQLAGVDVGEVTGTELAGSKVIVSFNVDKGIKLGRETTAAVKVATLLGTHYLEVDPQGGGELPDGRIPLAQTSVPFNLQDVIDAGTAGLDELDPVLLGRALSSVADTLQASGEELGPALDGITRISRVVAKRSGQYGDLLAATRDVTDQLSRSSDDLVVLMEQASLVSRTLTQRRDVIHRLLINVESLSTALSGIVNDTRDDIRPTLRDLKVVTDVLREREKQLAKALSDLNVGARYIANATGNGPFADLNVPPGVADNIHCLTASEC